MTDIISTPPQVTGNGKIKNLGQSADKRIKEERLKAACAQFEALFVYQLLKRMRDTIPKAALFHGGLGEDTYTSMFDQEVASKLAEGKGIGLAQRLYEKFSEQAASSKRSETPGLISHESGKENVISGAEENGAQKR